MPDFSDLIAASKKMSEKMKETQERFGSKRDFI